MDWSTKSQTKPPSFYFSFFFLGARHSQCKQGRGHSSLPLKYVAVFKEYEKHFTSFLRMNVKLLQPFQSKNVVFKPFRRGVDGAATDLQNHRC